MSTVDLTELLASLGVTLLAPPERLHRGRNSRVFRGQTREGRIAIKQFHLRNGERQRREVAALAFLAHEGVTDVPELLGSDPGSGITWMSYLDGEPALRRAIDDDDIGAALTFLETLHRLRFQPSARSLVIASEAMFRMSDLFENLELRLRPLAEIEILRPVIANELQPAYQRARAMAERELSQNELPDDARTLSPSDFGFHNAIRRPDGRLSFVDFEHFGWDDPAKTVSDFVLHPGMALTSALRNQFAEGLITRLEADDPTLCARTLAFGPLYAVKWATILLNEYLPEAAARRRFAANVNDDPEVLRRQLEAARAMLMHVDDFADLVGLERWNQQ